MSLYEGVRFQNSFYAPESALIELMFVTGILYMYIWLLPVYIIYILPSHNVCHVPSINHTQLLGNLHSNGEQERTGGEEIFFVGDKKAKDWLLISWILYTCIYIVYIIAELWQMARCHIGQRIFFSIVALNHCICVI